MGPVNLDEVQPAVDFNHDFHELLRNIDDVTDDDA
jgi:hypothetical protein